MEGMKSMARGRPSTYDPERHPKIALAFARKGATNIEIAEVLRINQDTLNQWCKKHQELSDALKCGKAEADSRIEASLYQRAIGYTYIERKEFVSTSGQKRFEITHKTVPPDTTAQIFWLKNRRPDEWRDKQQQEITGKDGGPIELAKTMTDEEIEEKARKILERRNT